MGLSITRTGPEDCVAHQAATDPQVYGAFLATPLDTMGRLTFNLCPEHFVVWALAVAAGH